MKAALAISALILVPSVALGACIESWAGAPLSVAEFLPERFGEPDCAAEEQACRWRFDLGRPVSRDAFEVLRGHLADCPDLIGQVRDAGVNHPDFYDAWLFRFATGALTLSVKDKHALGSTFVTLRVADE